MKARLPLLLAALAVLSACAARPPGPPLVTTPGARPEIVIHAPLEPVRVALVTQQKGEGATLASQSENRLVFVRQVSTPTASLLYDFTPTGAPYVRATYTLAAAAHGTRVSVANEIVSRYGTAAERARPFDPPSLGQGEQRGLLRLRTVVESR